MGGYIERFCGKTLPVLYTGTAISFGDYLQDFIIIVHGGDTEGILIIFGGGTYQGNAPYIDLFYNILFRSTAGHRFFKRVKVYYDDVQLRDPIFLQLGLVTRMVLTVQDSPEHFRVQGLYPSPQNRGIACNIFNGDYIQAQFLNKFFRTAGRINGDPQFVKLSYQWFQSIFMEYGY